MSTKSARVINLIPLIDIDTESQMKIRDIRNEANVRKWMFTDHIIEVNEHLRWINRLKTDDEQIMFAILDKKRGPLGVIGADAIDRLHGTACWAFYLAEDARGGLGSAIFFSFLDFVFDSLGIEKLNGEVIEGNDAVMKFREKFLFQKEGLRRSNIIKNGARIGVHQIGLTKEEWNTGKARVYEKHKKDFDKFSISIQWNETRSSGEKHPIDAIEAARARNNLNWMSILRLALEKSPENAKSIISEIRKIDREISDLTQRLITE